MFRILSICKGGGYRYCRTDPPHPRKNAKGLYPLHIVLMENKLGRLLVKGEDVHHRDDDKTNDDPANLEVKTKRDHARGHALERAPLPVSLVCPECQTHFELKPAAFRLRKGRNKSGGLFCSRSCGTSWTNRMPNSGQVV